VKWAPTWTVSPRTAQTGLTLAVALAAGIALASWSASTGIARPLPLLPRGLSLDRLLDEAQASPSQRDQAHQIVDAAEIQLSRGRVAERDDRRQMARLFSQQVVDPGAFEALRQRIEARHDAQSRRSTQALIDVGLVLNPGQRQAIATQLAGGAPLLADLSHSHPAFAAND